MKTILRSVFGFIINPLEKGNDEFAVNPLGRKVLIAMGGLFSILGCGSLLAYSKLEMTDPTYLFPGGIFLIIGLLGLIVGCLANDRAVAKIWGGNR